MGKHHEHRGATGWVSTVVVGVILAVGPSADAVSARAVTGESIGGDSAGPHERSKARRTRSVSYSRPNYLWPFEKGPYYGDAGSRSREDRSSGLLHTSVGVFDLTHGRPDLPPALMATDKLDPVAQRYFVVMLDPAATQRGASLDVSGTIIEQGGAVVHRMPVAAMIARLTPRALTEIESLPEVLAVEPYHPAFKLHPSIGRTPLLDPIKAVSEIYDLDVRLFPGESAPNVASMLEKLRGEVVAVFPDSVRVEIHRSRLADVAAIEAVYQVFEHLPAIPQDERTTATVLTGRFNQGAVPYHDAGVDGGGGGVDGTGGGGFAALPQVLMILDTGIQIDAGDLADSRTNAGTPGDGHRKVQAYETTIPFGGDGDLLGCDSSPSNGNTHGHGVAAVALGRATAVDSATYGEPFFAVDPWGGSWGVDGVAPGARLVAYDAQRTPAAGSCADPMLNTLAIGDLYSQVNGPTGSLIDAYSRYDARILNLSWGSPLNAYDNRSMDIDSFLADTRDALVIIAAGNAEWFVPGEPGSLYSPGGAKNSLTVGASRVSNDPAGVGQEETRAGFSGQGPAPGDRVAPQLMAPGEDWTLLGFYAPWYCRTHDNDQDDPVECDVTSDEYGTSASAAAASGAALIVRDYFAQGFYPDGSSTNPANGADQVENVSGALIKAVLVASADFMDGNAVRFGDLGAWPIQSHLSRYYRFNNEQGYGRIQLDNVLPLQNWPRSVNGLAVVDGGIDGGVGSIAGLDGLLDLSASEIDVGTIEVCDPKAELRVALAWTDSPGEYLVNNLDLEVISPTGVTYFGNYFTDDDDRNGSLDVFSEDCPGIDGATGTLSDSEWSLPACQSDDGSVSPRDTLNPTEAVMLSPDPLGVGRHGQIEEGTWTIRVIGAGGIETAQRYALVVAGGVCLGSRVSLDSPEYACNGTARITVGERYETYDPAPTSGIVSERVTVQVLDGTTVIDEETGLSFSPVNPGGTSHMSDPLVLSDATAPDPGNGVLDVRHGYTIRATYADVGLDGVTPDPDRLRVSQARVDCMTDVSYGNVVFDQIGLDTSFRVSGGCERNARGNFEFGFPDRYMDAGEFVTFAIGFSSRESTNLSNLEAGLRCVLPDEDSPSGCRPGTGDCADPNRLNNPSCDHRSSGHPQDVTFMTILDTPKLIGFLPAGARSSIAFAIRMGPTLPETPEVEMLLSLRAPISGLTAEALVVIPQTLNSDEQSLYYSTDFPTGGTSYLDYNNDETLENPITVPGNQGDLDYRFETIDYSDLTAGGTKNLALMSPWNFDTNDGGFRSGVLAITDITSITNTIAQWGEDLNFNGVDDKRCTDDAGRSCTRDSDCDNGTCESVEQRDPADNVLDKSWNIRGGCGWQTKPPGTCSTQPSQGCFDDGDCPAPGTCSGPVTTGGIWHTGRIGGTTGNCLVTGNNPGQCQAYETVGGTSGARQWAEALVTPPIQKVNGPEYRVEIQRWAWNMALDLADDRAKVGWEFDNDALALEPVDLLGDSWLTGRIDGPAGPLAGSGASGNLMFGPLGSTLLGSTNGTLGNNREADNACYFEGGAVHPDIYQFVELPSPPDDDLDNDGDSQIDEYVQANGPLRNWGVDYLRDWTLEDRQGPSGDLFQAAVTLAAFGKEHPGDPDPRIGYGVGIDDMVVEWREIHLVPDASDCESGECAVVDLKQSAMFEGRGLLEITVLENSPSPENDCDLDGQDDGTNDCDEDGTPDVVVRVSASSDPGGEIVALNESLASGVYVASLPISTLYNAPGVLFVNQSGSVGPDVTATYVDRDDGTGEACRNSIQTNLQGFVQASIRIITRGGNVVVVSTELTDNGDDDGFADSNETVDMRIVVANKTAYDLTNLVARLSSDDPKIDCILDSVAAIDVLQAGQEVLFAESFTFRVADVDRSRSGLTDLDQFSAEFEILFAADQIDNASASQSVVLDLDLDAIGGSGTTTFFEGFESGGFGAFTPMNLDAGLHSLEASDGYRCQYTDPDWSGSNSFGNTTDCYLGASPAQVDSFFWQIHTPDAIDGGRAYSGVNSLYMGIFGPAADAHTTPVGVLEAVRTLEPINLGLFGSAPTLSFKHQVAFPDDRCGLNTAPGVTPDRAIVQLQLAGETGNPVGPWIKIEPFHNTYDQQGQDLYSNCSFDPIDDGNTEDDFFDPGDPARRLGPSSTCMPEFVFSCQGDTFSPFATRNICYASDGPGLAGTLGLGSWIESKFNLKRFRGRRVRLRFLNSAIKLGLNETWEAWGGANPIACDDGWWIDDVQISNVLSSPATITNDDKDNSLLPGCGNTCNVVSAALDANPTALPAPGQVVELSAREATADRCLDGLLQFRYWIDGDQDGDGGGTEDVLLRTWTDVPEMIDAPSETTAYLVEVRCSSDPACVDSQSVTVTVNCPSTGRLGGFPTVLAPTRDFLSWGTPLVHDFAVGAIAGLDSYATSDAGTMIGPTASLDVSADNPPAGTGLWYLFRQSGPLGEATSYCNAPGIGWGSPARDVGLP